MEFVIYVITALSVCSIVVPVQILYFTLIIETQNRLRDYIFHYIIGKTVTYTTIITSR